ncbi:MAG: vWA domain-containing protein [Planctomycetota bacterium]
MIEWLLGIETLDLSDAAVTFGWARGVPGFVWLGIALGAVLLATATYRGIGDEQTAAGGSGAWRRWALGACRALLLATLAVLLAGPQLERADERTEPDWLVVLADRSSSLTIGDGPGGIDRDESLQRSLEALSPTLEQAASDRRVLSLGFDSGVFDLPLADDGMIDAGEPVGARTLIGRSLSRALERVAARPVAGVVVLSDGASDDGVEPRSLQRLRSERIPVYVVPLGSDVPAGDLAIVSADAPSAGFVGDRLPVRVRLGRTGAADALGGTLELVERSTGIVLDRRQISQGESEVTLLARPADPGEAIWDVRLVPAGADLLEENNAAEVRLSLIDRPLRVLLADGTPRWEFRYLKNLLVRERSIASSVLLLATGRRHIQEGDVVLSRFPSTPEDWEPFDVVVLGDLRADLLGEAQHEHIRDLVAERGAGLLWIAGPGSTPQSWRGTALEPLLPISVAEAPATYGSPVTMARDALAERLGILELADDAKSGGWPDALIDPATGWSLLRWAQRFSPEQIKPSASVLASFVAGGSAGDRSPAVLTMRYGAGRVVYVATDEIWRWRYARGEALPERFWVPLIRLLGREGLSRAGRSAVLSASPSRVSVGGLSTIEAELIDSRLVEASPSTLRVSVTDEAGNRIADVPLASDAGAGRSRRYTAAWAAPVAGSYTIEVSDPAVGDEPLSVAIDVIAPDDERQRAETDHGLLASLAEQTGGAVLQRDELASLGDRLPNRERRIVGSPVTEPLWDSPLALIFVSILLAIEWIGRRLLRLV